MTTPATSAGAPTHPTVFTDAEAEWKLLSALATSGRPEDLARVVRDDFTTEARRVIFDAIARRLTAGEPIDCILLTADVRPAGVSALDVFDLFTDPGVSVPIYIPLVRECRLRRLLHSLGVCLAAHATDPAREPRDVVRWLHRQLPRLAEVAPGAPK
jgi:replicative DNA helicase